MSYLLRPASRRFKWLKGDGIFDRTLDKKNRGIPLAATDIPLEVTMNGDFVLPDFVQSTVGSIFVTERALEALDRFAPGCCQFFPVRINAPPRMEPAPTYFYLDVTARAQTIDWTRSDTRAIAIPGSEGQFVHGLRSGYTGQGVFFWPPTETDPPIWREADARIGDVEYITSKIDELVSDDLWQALSAEFPGQLEAMKLGEE